MRNKVLQAQLDGVPFALCPSSMSALLEMANTETPRAEGTPRVAHDSVVYQKIGAIAIISVDGGMYKKGVNGMCSSIASYEQLVKFRDAAEEDAGVETVVYRVDTPGGAVAGADEAEAKIFTSKKKTITFFENMGASAGIWVFMASDEVYASETTMLGSIGVVVSYMEQDEDDKRIEIVSKNAPNKRCSLNGDCKEKITSMINTYEDMFHARVEKNTGFTTEQIKSTFNNGGMIFAKEAHKAGFIKDVMTFDALLKSLNIGSTIPTASRSDNLVIENTGADMKFDRENLDAAETAFNALVANRDTLTNRNDSLALDLQTVKTALDTKNDEMTTLVASHESQLSEAEGKVATAEKGLVDFKAETTTRLQEADSTGVSVSVALAMVQAATAEDASVVALKSQESGGHTPQNSAHEDGDIKKRCDALDITFVD